MTTTRTPAARATAAASLPFDIDEVPFSSRGSWLNVSRVTAPHHRSDELHLVSHRGGMHAVLSLVALHGDRGTPIPAVASATPAFLGVDAGSGRWEAVFETEDTLRIRGAGIGLRIADAVPAGPFDGSYLFRDPVDGAAVFSSAETGRRYRVSALSGELHVSGGGSGVRAGHVDVAPAARPDAAPWEWEIAVEEIGVARPAYDPATGFDDAVERSGAAFASYARSLAPTHAGLEGPRDEPAAAALAAYVMWSATVAPAGAVTREAVLMSKHWMDRVWSWDNCFNALALAPGQPDAAAAQFLLVFDHQDASGALPDMIGSAGLSFGFVKPPVHGWALRALRARMNLSPAQLSDAYDGIAALTRFWLRHRTVPGHALPHYQHGNDSGWDNSTLFDHDRLSESPDLAALLVVQLDVLAGLSRELGRGEHAAWAAERDRLRDALLAELWDGERFVARSARDGQAGASTSLLSIVPIVAAEHLPGDVVAALAARVPAFLTEHGLATEEPSSAAYEPDGYWRGPIWGPSTVLVVDGLRRSGHGELADDIAERYLRLCERSGFAENFDALSGDGLRDRAYTWTASCYLLLAGRDGLAG